MRTKRFLSIVLTLAILLGMFPGMSLTASAADTTNTIKSPATTGTMNITLTIAAASVKTAPEANTLTYSGSAQTLTTTGEAGVGTLQYQLGESATTEPTGTWGTTVPQGTEAKDYYVWYRSRVNDNNISTAGCKTVTIAKASITNATVTLSDTSLVYTGSEQSVTVSSVKLGDTTLTADTDYEVTSGTTGTAKNTYTVTVTGRGNYKDTATAQWSIGLATPTITTIPTASVITYGQKLADSILTDGTAKLGDNTVAGTFAWKNTETKPAVSDSDTTEYDVVFTPTDEDNYAAVECKVKLTVNKADPTNTVGQLSAIRGQKLADVALPTADNGAWSWVEDTTTTLENVGMATYHAKFTPNDTANYNTLENVEVKIQVAEKPSAVAATVTANNRTYDGTEKPLVNVDESTLVGGEMQFATGTKDAATQPYTTSIPTATEAGTYYVWYKAVSDEDHSDSKPACITVTISKPAVAPAPADEEKGEANFKPSAAAPDVKGVEQEAIKTQMEELAKADDTKLKAGQVKEVTVNMETKAVAESDVPKKEASAIKETAEGMIPAKDRESTKCDFLDIAVSKIVIVYDVKNGQKVKNESDSISAGLTNLAQVIDIPVKYDLTGKFNPLIVRYHNGKAEAFRRLYAAPAKDALKDGTYYVEGTGKNAIVHIYTNRFSTYALLTSGTEEYPKLGDSVTVYRLYYGPTMEHFYTTSAYERRVLIDKYGWVDEGIAWKSPKAPTTDEEKKTIKPVYRLFNPFTTDHHYTKDANERKTLIEKYGWKDEGVAFYSNEKGDATVYRLWHPGLITGAHHFTTGKHEYDVLITRGWIGETEAFKVNAAS